MLLLDTLPVRFVKCFAVLFFFTVRSSFILSFCGALVMAVVLLPHPYSTFPWKGTHFCASTLAFLTHKKQMVSQILPIQKTSAL